MKKLIFLFIFSVGLFGVDFVNTTLKDFIITVSRTNKINIVSDNEVDTNIDFIVSKDVNPNTYFDVLKSFLFSKNLYLEKNNNFYIIRKINEKVDFKYRSIKLNFINFEDIKNFLKVYSDIKYEYINSSKLLLLYSSKENYKYISSFIRLIDKIPSQLKLKITILDTNLDKVKEFGIENQAQISQNEDSNFFFNLVAYPFSVNSDIADTKKRSFHSFVKVLNDSGNSKIVSSPVLTLSDNKETVFNVVTNVAFQTGTSVIDETKTKLTTAVDYRDVGLSIKLVPKIYKDLVYLDLSMEVSNLLSNVDNKPIVSKKYIQQSFHLSHNKILALTGINQTENYMNVSGVPVLMDIPYLRWLFRYENKKVKSSNLSIFFEIVNPDEDIKIEKSADAYAPIKLINKESNEYLHNQRVREMFGL